MLARPCAADARAGGGSARCCARARRLGGGVEEAEPDRNQRHADAERDHDAERGEHAELLHGRHVAVTSEPKPIAVVSEQKKHGKTQPARDAARCARRGRSLPRGASSQPWIRCTLTASESTISIGGSRPVIALISKPGQLIGAERPDDS